MATVKVCDLCRRSERDAGPLALARVTVTWPKNARRKPPANMMGHRRDVCADCVAGAVFSLRYDAKLQP